MGCNQPLLNSQIPKHNKVQAHKHVGFMKKVLEKANDKIEGLELDVESLKAQVAKLTQLVQKTSFEPLSLYPSSTPSFSHRQRRRKGRNNRIGFTKWMDPLRSRLRQSM